MRLCAAIVYMIGNSAAVLKIQWAALPITIQIIFLHRPKKKAPPELRKYYLFIGCILLHF